MVRRPHPSLVVGAVGVRPAPSPGGSLDRVLMFTQQRIGDTSVAVILSYDYPGKTAAALENDVKGLVEDSSFEPLETFLEDAVVYEGDGFGQTQYRFFTDNKIEVTGIGEIS